MRLAGSFPVWGQSIKIRTNVQTQTQRAKENKKQPTISQSKEQDKSPYIDLNEINWYSLPDREFKIAVKKILTEVQKIIHEQSKEFNKAIENIEKYQTKITELMNAITEIKKNSRVFTSILN